MSKKNDYYHKLEKLERKAENAYRASQKAGAMLQNHRMRLSVVFSIKGKEEYLDGELLND